MIFGLRILPLTIVMAMLMLVVKVSDLVRGGSELSAQFLVGPVVAETKQPEEAPAATPPAAAEAKPAEQGEHGEAKKAGKGKKDDPQPEIKGTLATERPEGTGERRFTPAELDLLQNLAKRRAELDKWEQNVQLKENLLSASEMRVNEKLEQIDALKKELSVLLADYNKQEDSKIGSLVKIYENMKPADAARIFEEMDMPVLLEVVNKMAEKKAAPILANMTPRKAKQVTEELAQHRKTVNTRLNEVSKAVTPPPPSAASSSGPSAPAVPATVPTPTPATAPATSGKPAEAADAPAKP